MSSLRGTPWLRLIVWLLAGAWPFPPVGVLFGQEPSRPKPSSEAVQRYLTALQSDDVKVRRGAYTTLRQIGPGDKDGVPLILKTMSTGDSRIESGALAALRPMGSVAVQYLVEAAAKNTEPNVQVAAITALGYLQLEANSSVPCLLRALADDNAMVRREAIRAIQRFDEHSEQSIPLLATIATEDSDDQVRVAAVKALGHVHLKPGTSIPSLFRASSSDKDAIVRREAIRAILRFDEHSEETIPLLVSIATGDSDDQVRVAAVKGLGHFHVQPHTSVPCLVQTLSDESADVRKAGAVALRYFGSEAKPAVGALVRAIGDADEGVQAAAISTITKLGPIASEAVPTLFKALLGEQPHLNHLAKHALRKLTPERATELFGEVFDAVQARLDANRDLRVGEHDWPQLGGSRLRNNTPAGENIPTRWHPGEFDRRTGVWDSGKAFNVKWFAELGSQSYGNPVVANGKIYVGTNNGAAYLDRYPPDVDLGCLLCFRESDGKFLWQHSSEKLPTGRVHDWPLQGICSSPVIEGDRLWFVTNRGEVACLDTEGFYDDEDDGQEVGVWGILFETVTDLTPSASLPYSNTIKSLLASTGREAPSYVRIRKDTITDGWTVVTRNGKRVVPHYALDLDDSLLRIVPANDETAEVLEFEANLLDGITESKLSSALRAQFLGSGTELPERVEVRVVEPQKQWDLTAIVDGKQKDFRLIDKGEKLVCHVRITTPELKKEADVVWKFDMMAELGVSQHNMATCGPTLWGDVLFICTSNGVDETHVNIPAPEAPSFMAMDKNTGKVLWTDNSPGENILHGQWSCPVVGVFEDVPQVIFPGGDGWLYAFRADRWEDGKPELLWKFDCNPKESKWNLGGAGTRNNLIGVPVIYDGLVYTAVGQDPEHGEGEGHLWCIDPTRRGDVSPELAMKVEGDQRVPIAHKRVQAVEPEKGEVAVENPNSAVVWHYQKFDQNDDGKIDFEEEFHRTISSPAIKDDLLIIPDFSGIVHCINAKTGIPFWTYDLLAHCWGSPLIVEDKVYVGDEDGDVAVFRLSPDAPDELLPINEINMGTSVYQTPIVANNVLYIPTKSRLFAIENHGH